LLLIDSIQLAGIMTVDTLFPKENKKNEERIYQY